MPCWSALTDCDCAATAVSAALGLARRSPTERLAFSARVLCVVSDCVYLENNRYDQPYYVCSILEFRVVSASLLRHITACVIERQRVVAATCRRRDYFASFVWVVATASRLELAPAPPGPEAAQLVPRDQWLFVLLETRAQMRRHAATPSTPRPLPSTGCSNRSLCRPHAPTRFRAPPSMPVHSGSR